MTSLEPDLPSIPAKRYFTIGEVSELCGVKPHVLRYWEQEFTQLRPMKRRGNRRYYQHHEVLMIRRIRTLLYEQGFTINGARNRLQEQPEQGKPPSGEDVSQGVHPPGNSYCLPSATLQASSDLATSRIETGDPAGGTLEQQQLQKLLVELREIRDLLTQPFLEWA